MRFALAHPDGGQYSLPATKQTGQAFSSYNKDDACHYVTQEKAAQVANLVAPNIGYLPMIWRSPMTKQL